MEQLTEPNNRNERAVTVMPRGPIDAGRIGRQADARPEAAQSLLMEYVRLLKRRRSTILLLTFLGAVLGFATTLGVLPVYRARTSLDIQNLNADFMNMRAVAPTGGGENSSTEAYVQTQIKLLQSDTLRARTVERLKNGGAPSSFLRNDLLSGIRRFLHLPGNSSLTNEDLLSYTARKVAVKPLGLTRLVEITCDSWDPKFSADFCNSLVRQFAEQDREVRWSEAQKTSEWLTRQLADVKESSAASQKRLEKATGDDALVFKSASGGVSVSEEKLRELQAELTRAQSERVAKQALYEISKSDSPDSLPMILDSGQLRDSQIKLDDLRRQIAALVPPLTEANPKVQHLRAQTRELEASLKREKANVIDSVKKEYAAASQREALLKLAYSQQERLVIREQAREAQVSMLRREVDAGQQLYQTLLQRVKEAGFASAMQVSTIRVVDAARAPESPIAPRRGASTGVGLLLGMLSGISLAFFKDRTQTALRAPGEVPRYLNLRELGVIPSARRDLSHGYAKRTIRSLTAASAPPAIVEGVPDLGSARPLPDLAGWRDHASVVAEAFRNATYSVLLAGKEMDRAKTFVITSPNVGEGKTTVTCNLGLALAQAKRRVLLIDGDLRKPRLHEALDLPNFVGLRDLLRGDVDSNVVPMATYCQSTQVNGLYVITSGSGSGEPSGLLHSPLFSDLLERLAAEFDIVLIDSPPMLHLADARILAGMSNGVILVFRSRLTDRDAAMAARDLFVEDHVRVIGAILNDFDPMKEGQSQYYTGYYQYVGVASERASAAGA
jgi:capsular exopolysaccharide synthesis family protein